MSAPARRIAVSDLEDGRAFVELTCSRRALDHRVLAADVVGGEWHRRRILDASDHVKVRERRFDHHDVGALLDIEQRLADGLVGVRRVHLVATAVAERRRRVRRIAERPEERRGELGRVGHDRRVGQTVVVERRTDGADAPVHHVAGGDHVRAGAGLGDRRPRQELERRVVVDRAIGTEDPTVPVARVLAQTQVADHEQVRVGLLDRTRGELHYSFVVPRARAFLVLGRRQPEQQHGWDPERVRLARLGDGVGDRRAGRCRASSGSPRAGPGRGPRTSGRRGRQARRASRARDPEVREWTGAGEGGSAGKPCLRSRIPPRDRGARQWVGRPTHTASHCRRGLLAGSTRVAAVRAALHAAAGARRERAGYGLGRSQ